MGFEEDVKKAMSDAVEKAGNLNALALKCGLNQATIYRWVKGSRDPTLSGLSKIMDFMDMTVRPKHAETKEKMPHEVVQEFLRKSEEQELRHKNAKLEGQVELLKELLGGLPPKEKSVG